MTLTLSLFPGIGLLDMAFEQEDFCVVRGPDVLWGGDIRRFNPPPGRFDGVIGGPPCQSFSSLVHLVRANGCEPKFGNLIPEFERCVSEAAPAWFLMENVRAAPEPVVPGYAVDSFLLNNAWLLGEDGLGQEQERTRRFSFGVRGPGPAPNLLRRIDLAVLLLPKGDARGTVSQWSPDNSKEAKAGRHESLTGGHDKPPSARDRERRIRRSAQLASTDAVPVKIGGSGKVKRTALAGCHPSTRENVRYSFADACRLQGLPEDFLADSPLRADGKLKAIANGVPIPMGRAIARAVKEAVQA